MFLGLLDPDPDPLVRSMDQGPSTLKVPKSEIFHLFGFNDSSGMKSL